MTMSFIDRFYESALWAPIEEAGAGAPDAGSAPGGEAATPVDAGPGDTSFTLSDEVMSSDFDDEIEIPAQPEQRSGQEATPTQATPDKPAPEGRAPPAAAKPLAQQPTQPVVAPAAPVAPTQAAPPAGDPSQTRPLEIPELLQHLTQNREAMLDAIAKQHFQLSEKDVTDLDTNAVEVLPKLLARAFYAASMNSLNQIANMVPRMIETVTTEKVGAERAQNAFWGEWSNIDRNNAEHMRTVTELARVYRGAQPKASEADMIKWVGTAATAMLGLSMPARSAPVVRNGQSGQAGRRSVPAFTPAAASGAPRGAAAAPGQVDPWSGLGAAFDEG